MVAGAKPTEVAHLINSVGSQAASDTDDMLWEELLQCPDSASSGSSDSEEEGRHTHNHSLPPAHGLSSDEETFPHVRKHHHLPSGPPTTTSLVAEIS